MRLTYNLHSHTYRCGHAGGKDEEYAKEAYEAGYKTLGFSDHVFLPGINDPYMRGSVAMLDDYLSSIARLKKQYEGKMDVKAGFECEYSEQFRDYYASLLREGKVDYLILGQHCFFFGKNTYFYRDAFAPRQAFIRYVDDLIDGMESGLFLYVCHPDLFRLYYHENDELFIRQTDRIFEASKRLNMPLEVNMGNYYLRAYGREPFYPDETFWKRAAEAGVEVVVGVDAHMPSDYRTRPFEECEALIKRCGLKVIEDCPLKNKGPKS